MPDFDFAVQDGAFLVQDGAYTGDLVIETFDSIIGGEDNYDGSAGPWRGSESIIWTSSDSFRGASCGYRDVDRIIRKWSYPGDGHESYPELGGGSSPGSTISMAVRPLDNYAAVSFAHAPGHETDGYHCYRLLLDLDEYYDRFAFEKFRGGGDTPTIVESAPGVPDGAWYVIAVILDADGYGRHVGQLWSVDIDGPGTGERAELESTIIMDDTEYRGRGMGMIQAGEAYLDTYMLGLP
ncbi:hypothetical protein ACFPYI_01835 [Halomarina salina]|uniref:LamG domain-containing protein n=1 Tax=Halomarina salina TaxID=1872699 RepID=A0ABD5RHJ6_9EURY|nr:hypothetical protein [Halomarina salina]